MPGSRITRRRNGGSYKKRGSGRRVRKLRTSNSSLVRTAHQSELFSGFLVYGTLKKSKDQLGQTMHMFKILLDSVYLDKPVGRLLDFARQSYSMAQLVSFSISLQDLKVFSAQFAQGFGNGATGLIDATSSFKVLTIPSTKIINNFGNIDDTPLDVYPDDLASMQGVNTVTKTSNKLLYKFVVPKHKRKSYFGKELMTVWDNAVAENKSIDSFIKSVTSIGAQIPLLIHCGVPYLHTANVEVKPDQSPFTISFRIKMSMKFKFHGVVNPREISTLSAKNILLQGSPPLELRERLLAHQTGTPFEEADPSDDEFSDGLYESESDYEEEQPPAKIQRTESVEQEPESEEDSNPSN